MKSPKRTIDLRSSNRQEILQTLYLGGPMSRLDLSQRTQLSPGTVTNVTFELLQDQIIEEIGLAESEGGRPRTILAVNPRYGYLIGIDLGETHIQLELFDLAMNKKGTFQRSAERSENTPDCYVELIVESLQELIRNTKIERDMILGIGVGVPGVVGHNGEVSIAAPMWQWKHVPLLAMLEKQVNLPFYIDNGAKAMAKAEAWFGAGRFAKDMVVILMGTGIGAGVLTKGELYRGATNSAGEWGHTKIILDGRLCRCGSQGCVEAYAGAPGIIETMQQINPEWKIDADQLVNIQNLVNAYQLHDPFAETVMQNTARYLGAGMVNLVNLFNPELIVIGGWVGLLIGDSILESLTQYVIKNALPPSTENLKIGLCEFGQDAICTGAACLVLKEFMSANHKFIRRVSQPSLDK